MNRPSLRAVIRPLARLGAPLGVVVALASCYLPVRFDAEVELLRTGHYTAFFDGYVADVGLYEDLKNGKLNALKERDKADLIVTDLKRSSDIKIAKYLRDGIFHVNWMHKGDIIREKMHTFIRRNEAFLTFKYLEDEGRIIITGRKLKSTQVQQLAKMGLGTTEGQLRIKTAANVTEHNAQKVTKRKSGGYIYIWDIRTFDAPAPKLVVPVR
jgi:hypothetical protein